MPDQSVTISLSQLTKRTRLSCPTVIESLTRLEDLGLVVSTTHERGKVKTYYVPDPPEPGRVVRLEMDRHLDESSQSRPFRSTRAESAPRRVTARSWPPTSFASSTTCSARSRSRRWAARRSRSTWSSGSIPTSAPTGLIPSIRTIARQAGLSRQTVLAAIEELTQAGPAGHEQVEGSIDGLQDHPPGPGPRQGTSQEGEKSAQSRDRNWPNIL